MVDSAGVKQNISSDTWLMVMTTGQPANTEPQTQKTCYPCTLVFGTVSENLSLGQYQQRDGGTVQVITNKYINK